MIKRLALFLLIVGTGITAAQQPPDLARIDLPPGFAISIYAEGLRNPRSLALGDQGTVFVGSREVGYVTALVDTDGDQVADEQYQLGTDLHIPNGVAFYDGSLYVAEAYRIIRFDDIESQLATPPDPVVIYDDFPADEAHNWKYLAISPDEQLYVPIGMPCNVCVLDEDTYGVILRMNLDGSEAEIFARGQRNTVGFDWHPVTGDFWFTDNGRDWISNDLPPDELNVAPAPGLNFGFPYCHGGFLIDIDFGEGHDCADYTPPAQNLGAHVAPLGMDFYSGAMFPADYQNQIFIAEHGSWNSTVPIGYRITLVRLAADHLTPTSYEVFAKGWLGADGSIVGRPVDILEMPDGSLLVSDDLAGVIYRITYTNR